jgi:two-component system cell cycle sensor histidine kinase/response regulator CckA
VPLTRPFRRALFLVGVVLLGAFGLGGWRFAQREIDGRLSAQLAELASIAQLKALQLSEWYRERIDDALGRAADPLLVASVSQWLSGDRSAQLEGRIRGALTPRREPWRYLNVWLLDRNGRSIFDARRSNADATLEPGLLAECLQTRRPVFGVLHDLDTATPFVDICMPVIELTNPEATPLAVEVYRADASQLLLPAVKFWTRTDDSAITTVIRFDGDEAEVVVSSVALALPGDSPVIVPIGFLSPASRDRVATDVTGRDGHRRLIVSSAVVNTPWTVIAGITRNAALRGAYEEIGLMVFVMAALAITGYLSVLLVLGRREREIARQTLRLDRLLQVRSAINEAIVRIHDRDLMLARFCELAASLGRFELAAVYEWHEERRSARLAVWHGDLPPRLRATSDIEVDAAVREGPIRALFEGGKVAIVPDLKAETPNRWTTALLAAGHRAVVALPIREGGRVTGSFWMYSSEPGVFDRRDLQFFDELTGDINYALENVRAEQRRRDADLQLQTVTDAAPFGMFLIAHDDLRIERANAAALRQYGYSEAEVIGQHADMIFAPEDLTPTLPLGDGASSLPVTARHRSKEGRPLTVEITARPVVVGGRRYDLVVAVDVTERRQLEEQYRQAQRLEAVGKLAGGIAHDFNNLLTVISGYAAFALEDLPPDGTAREAAEQIQIASKRASDLTSSLLAFSRRQVLNVRYVRLNDVVRETATLLSRLISEDVRLDLHLDANRDAVNVDPSQMQQVLMNLAVNARDAMAGGGRLTIGTRDLDGHVELRVSDTGQGIAPEVLEHIFEPFYTTKPAGEGTGLGLPTVHGIVTQSGGTITVDTQVGRGTTFSISLPRADRAPEAAPSPLPPASRPAGKRTVMIVEDDDAVRELARLVLSRGGYEVIAFTNGAAALDKAASSRLDVDLVLTDVVMPGMSGPELVQRLRAYHPNLPVVFMSGYAEEAANRLNIDAATLNLLSKPFAPRDLLKRIDEALGGQG